MPEVFKEILTVSKDTKKGLTLFLDGNSIAGLVTNITEDGYVELRSQQYSRIVVRLDRISAIALA
jgi:hypothetical protein